ncbi:MAG: SMP-30/gluconolactonase/LRE family protein [Colwellia sp.]|nr:SMP-30/gluconolactonase/LRE family protein [Colwellia sp.]
MLKNTLLFISLLVISTLLSTSALAIKTVLYQSEDWVSDGIFTQGIEGPAVAKDGSLYVVNYQQEGTIGRVVGKNQVELLVKLANGSVGNGIRFDSAGNMYVADYVNHNVLRITKNHLSHSNLAQQAVEVYGYQPLMNQPNDIAIMDNGILFASDPNWAKSTGQLWRIGRDAQIMLLEEAMGTTNGIEVSPDNKTLYVNESVQRNIWQYDLAKDGSISNKRLLIHFSDFGLDGMRTDKQGNLYVARYGKGVIAVVSPQGKLLREVTLKGKFPTNVAFGGSDGKTVFVTMQKRGAIDKFTSEFSGRSFNFND